MTNQKIRLYTVIVIQTIFMLLGAIISEFTINSILYSIITFVIVLYFFFIPYTKEETMYAVPGLTTKGLFNKILRISYLFLGSIWVSITIFDIKGVF